MLKTYFLLAKKSLWFRRNTVGLALFSLMMSIFLLLSVDVLRQAAETGFTQTISQTDLIVGARTGPTNLVLATVFNRGTFANNISLETYEEWKENAAVEWTIPLVLGDGHRGYRVLGTDENFFKHYHYQGTNRLQMQLGHWFQNVNEVVVGSEVAKTLNYQLDQTLVVDHGVTHDLGMIHHDEHPLVVKGILSSTGTIIDQTVFVTMESLAEMHDGVAHEIKKDESSASHEEAQQSGAAQEHHHGEKGQISAFFMRLKNRVDVLNVQRQINNETHEPLSAVIPSVVVNELWHMMSYLENALRVLSVCILVVSLLSMVSILLATLNERRREMAILRSLGASPLQLAGLLILESTFITCLALGLGVCLQIGIVYMSKDWLKSQFGLFVSLGCNLSQGLTVLIVLAIGLILGIWPAYKVYRSSLKDGLNSH